MLANNRVSWRQICVTTVAMVAGVFGVACARDSSRDTAGSNGAASARVSSEVAWGVPLSLTAQTGGGAAPMFAVSRNGRLALAWVSAPDRGKEGRLYVQPDAGKAAAPGATADDVVELHDPLGSLSIFGEVPPKIAYAPDGALYAAYLVTKVVPGKRWPQNALRFAVSKDGGETWEAPNTVTGDKIFGSYDDHALHVGANGTVYLSWLAEVRHDSSHTYFSRSDDRGRTWSKPITVDFERSCPCCRTAIASAPDGSLYIAWRKRFPVADGEERDIVVARSTDNGAAWSKPARVHADAWRVDYCPDAGPTLKVASNGTVHVAWWTGKEGSAGTQYAQSIDGGRTFSAPVPLGLAHHSRAAHIQLALGSGADSALVVAAWDDGTRRIPQVVVRVSRDGGRTFAPAEPVSAAGSHAGFPVVALSGDTVLLAWQERSLAAAAKDSAEKAKKDKNDAATYVNAVGAMQVVTRSGVLSRPGGGQ